MNQIPVYALSSPDDETDLFEILNTRRTLARFDINVRGSEDD